MLAAKYKHNAKVVFIMTYEQVVAKVKAKYAGADASSVAGTLAIQVNLAGKNVEGIFYIEAKDGKVNVEPYDYHDNKAVVTVAPTNLLKILDGKMNPVIAYTTGKVSVDGDPNAVLTLIGLAK